MRKEELLISVVNVFKSFTAIFFTSFYERRLLIASATLSFARGELKDMANGSGIDLDMF